MTVIDMYCVKPLDKETIVKYAEKKGQSSDYGRRARPILADSDHGVSRQLELKCPRKVINIALPMRRYHRNFAGSI